jgi:glutamyl-tRNA synthetase
VTVRARFCPSPTGYFHVGGGRTALFNWFFVKQQGGEFVLRIEDTDEERNKEEWVLGIHNAMRWLGLEWDEYYRQSERLALYSAAAQRLIDDGNAYYCDCTNEDVQARKGNDKTPGYDGFCRDRGLTAGALRFQTPDDGTSVVHDVVLGDVEVEFANIRDFVLQRTDGSPLFILANVVDDMDMRITHVIRSQEHLSNTHPYQLLWGALDGGALPVFAHVPTVVNEKRQKLSKRRPTDNVELEQYIADGYIAPAMVNYLALLGWSPGDDEIVGVEEMIERFRLEDVKSAPAFFDVQKLRHFNGEYIRKLSRDEFVAAAGPYLQDAVPFVDYDLFEEIAPLVQERIEVLSEVGPMIDFLFVPEPQVDEAAWDKHMKGNAAQILDDAIRRFSECDWKAESIKAAMVAVGEGLGLGLTKAHFPVRVAVTGKAVGPPLFESLAVLGRDATLGRLRKARERLG